MTKKTRKLKPPEALTPMRAGFDPQIVKGLLAGSITRVSKPVDPQPTLTKPFDDGSPGYAIAGIVGPVREKEVAAKLVGETLHKPPYGHPGRRLWLSEPWRTLKAHDQLSSRAIPRVKKHIYYDFDADPGAEWSPTIGRYRHAHDMPRWASRMNITVAQVHIARAHGTSPIKAMCEGASFDPDAADRHTDTLKNYEALFDQVHGQGTYAANPWVWVYELEIERDA